MFLLKISRGNPRAIDFKKLMEIKSNNAEWLGKPQEYKHETFWEYWRLNFHKSQDIVCKLKFYSRGDN